MLMKISYALLAIAIVAWVYLFLTSKPAEAPAPELEETAVTETLPVVDEPVVETEVVVEEEVTIPTNEASAGGNDFGMELPLPDKEY